MPDTNRVNSLAQAWEAYALRARASHSAGPGDRACFFQGSLAALDMVEEVHYQWASAALSDRLAQLRREIAQLSEGAGKDA